MTNREIDALVAEKVMGLVVSGKAKTSVMILNSSFDMPYYSTNISDAWKVVEKMKSFGFEWAIFPNKENTRAALFYELTAMYEVSATTIQEAICLAALKAKGVEV